MPIPYASHSISFHHYSSWGRDDPWAHSPSYFRPYYVGYAAPRESSCAGQPCVENDQLKPKDRDGCKDTSSGLNAIDEKPINVLKTSAIDGNEKKNSAIDILKTKSGQRELRLEVKRRSPLSETEAKSSHPLERKDKNMAWVPKGSIPIQDKDDGQAKGSMQLKKKRKSKRRFSNMRFAPNHQNYWSVHHHPFDSQMPYTPMSWNSSLDMYGYPSYSYFDPWRPYGSLYHGGLLQNCYAY
ncbi:hypothetical protein PVAP13_8NG162400 [Panicum virgatum]|uniref:Uncharacterized protein n=1 Tax=Panicum virgatum TaxID=38727 RepID=A0A8T0P4G0_PANVG|nr:hypothetical protein PVAP13_8NG162400 [Panicum virgatum]